MGLTVERTHPTFVQFGNFAIAGDKPTTWAYRMPILVCSPHMGPHRVSHDAMAVVRLHIAFERTLTREVPRPWNQSAGLAVCSLARSKTARDRSRDHERSQEMKLRSTSLAALIGLTCLVCAQLVPVERDNPTVASSPSPPATVSRVLRASCYDCHSNETVWPWYSHVAPISWLLASDVHRARKTLNFSDWDRLGPTRQAEMLADAQGEIEEGAMPPSRYLRLHREAKLTPETKAVLLSWMQGILQASEQTRSPEQ